MPTKIYAVFLGKPKGRAGWPYADLDCEKRRDYLLGRLKELCGSDIEFVGRDIIYESKEAEKIKERVRNVDGILLYTLTSHFPAPSPERILDIDSPIIVASDLFGGDMLFLQACDLARRKEARILPVSSSDPEDVKRALELVDVIRKLKGRRILIIEESKEAGDQSHFWRREYEDYLDATKSLLGVEVIVLGPEKLVQWYEKTDEKAAKGIAIKWMREADRVVEPSEDEIVKSAKLYLAMRRLMEEIGADGITIDCLPLFYEGRLPAYPCLGFSQFNNEGSLGACEADLEATLSQLIGQYLTGRPGFISDPVIDTASSQIVYAHCVAPTRPFGKDSPAAPYRIRSHAEDRKGASIQAILPPNQPLTTIKVNALAKKLAIHQARSIGNVDEERACRTKLAAEANVRKILENWDFQTFGWHRVTFYGDFREDFCGLAKLLGLTVVEEDR